MTRLFSAVLVAVFSLFLATAHAQSNGQSGNGVDYSQWERLAGQIEDVIEAGTATDARLEALRADVVRWRDQFLNAQGANSTRIATLRDQIAALGSPPAEGKTEPEDIAARRKELNDQLSKLQAPGLTAVEAFGRADGIVQQIDSELRERQANALMQLSPSPLNPVNWASAWEALHTIGTQWGAEAKERATRIDMVTQLKSNAPAVIGYLLVAILLLTKGRSWVETLPGRLSKRASESSRAAVEFGVSLGQILLPMIGALLLVMAFAATGLFGPWGEPILFSLIPAMMTIVVGRWLVSRLFPRADGDLPLHLPTPRRIEARYHSVFLTYLLALYTFLTTSILPLSGVDRGLKEEMIPYQVSETAAAVLYFPLIVVASLVLFRLCQILRRSQRYADEGINYRVRLVSIAGGVGVLIALIAPILAAIGYISGANALLWPAIMTLGLMGALIVLQDFIADLYVAARRGKDGRDSLAPVLVGFALVLASVPFFALIWGARPSDIAEFWNRAQQGLSFGGIRLSPTAIVTFVIVFFAGMMLTRLVQGAFRTSILPKTRLDSGAQTAAVSGLGYIGIFLAALLAITSAGIDLSSLAIVAGALSVGIGFGLQNIVSNFVSGIILLIERPITVGDWVEVGGRQGYVRSISVRSTRIETFDRTDVIVPNADFVSGQVVNFTRGNLSGRLIVPVGVAYGADTRKVDRILREIADDQPMAMLNPPPNVLFIGFGADSLNFEIRLILSDVNQGMGVRSAINHEIARRFAEEGIEIPYAQRDLWLRNPEALREALFPGQEKSAPHDHKHHPEATAHLAPPKAKPPEAEPPTNPDGSIRSMSGGAGDTGDSDGDGDSDR